MDKFKLRVKVIYIVIFILLCSVVLLLTTIHKNNLINQEASRAIEILKTNYDITNFYTSSDAKAIDGRIQNDTKILEIFAKANNATKQEKKILREQLYKRLNKLYQIIRKKGVLQFQFVFPDNRSFLRMHKPSKFGDNLEDVRYSFRNTNITHKPSFGFEQGRTAHAFRNVFPLFYNEKYIGSYEISYASEYMQNNITKVNKIHTHFLVNKNIFKSDIWKRKYVILNYVQSMEHKDFMTVSIDKKNSKNCKAILNREIIDKKIKTGEPFAFYSDVKKDINVVTFLPIKNVQNDKVLAYLVSYTKNESIDELIHSYIMINLISFILMSIILYLLYKKEIAQKKYESDIVQNTKFTVIGQMSAGITHEINTPLSYIKGLTEMSRYDLEDMPNNDFKKQLLDDNERVMDGVKRMGIIIESMREMSQTSNQNIEEQNIYATLIVVLRMLYNKSKIISKIYINDEHFTLENSNKNRYKFMANIQKQRIEQVWTIILNNALDELIKVDIYENRRLDITIKKVENNIVVSIDDNAGGIPEKIINTVFEPFTSTKESSGIGIGLNIAKKIIEEHNGKIEASNTNKGACFTTTLSAAN
ncbi:MAG: ATP-binding protein [Campylobacterota bacterium]|nr:ATP-binding protein [Campylobacterota bacterium]